MALYLSHISFATINEARSSDTQVQRVSFFMRCAKFKPINNYCNAYATAKILPREKYPLYGIGTSETREVSFDKRGSIV